MKINNKKQYLFVISRIGEDECYFFYTIDDMCLFWRIASIEELLKEFNTTFSRAHIYEVTKEWSFS